MDNIKPCPVCGIGDHSGHDGWRFCNECGFHTLDAAWNRLSSQAARIAALEAEAAPLRELWAAVEGLEHRMRTDKEDVFHIRATLSHKQPGQISAALVGRVGAEKKHMGALDEVREPTLAAALIALGEAPDA